MTTTTFFATRTLARAAAVELKGKVQDFGSTAARGERWAVIVEVQEVQEVPAAQEVLAIPAAHRRNLSVNAQARVSTLTNKYKKPVQVTVKRSKQAELLAAFVALTAQ